MERINALLQLLSLLVLLTITSCLRPTFVESSSSQYLKKNHLSRYQRASTVLYETYASGTSSRIEPAVYQEDLYEVLGLHLNATKVELRDAYWAIAFRTHPDRNDTPEALSDFRNASHAYKVLGRSEQTRSEYDSRYRTRQYIDSIDQLSRDVIAPFAMDVAMPLIDLTVRGIGSFAVPFFKDAYEQSSSVFRAAFQTDDLLVDEDREPTGFEAITRAANAAMRTGLEQRIRRTKDSIGSTTVRLESTVTQLEEAIVKEKSLLKSLEELRLLDDEGHSNLRNFTKSVEISKEELRNLQRIEQQEEEKYLQSRSTIATLLETSVILSEAKKLEDEEIVRLERALRMAREKNVNTVMKLATVDVALSNENKASEIYKMDFEKATELKNTFLASYAQVDVEVLGLTVKYSITTRDKMEGIAESEKQNSIKTSLERRKNQLTAKKTSLMDTLVTLEAEWNLREGETASAKEKILRKRKISEDKITEDRRIATEIAEIAEMQYILRKREKELEMMELERMRLVKLEALENEKARAKEILEILKRTEDIADANSKRNLTFSSPPPSPPHQRLNPFSRKEKYDSRKIVENPKKIEIEKRKMSIWTTQKTPVNYAQFEDFYTT